MVAGYNLTLMGKPRSSNGAGAFMIGQECHFVVIMLPWKKSFDYRMIGFDDDDDDVLGQTVFMNLLHSAKPRILCRSSRYMVDLPSVAEPSIIDTIP